MLKLNASFSKKQPIQGQQYSSEGYMASVEVELPDGLTQKQLEARIADTFELVRESVEKEISGVSANAAIAPVTPIAQKPVTQDVVEFASNKQVKYLLDIARGKNVPIDSYLHQYGVADAGQLSRQQCSQLIDHLSGKKAA